METMTPERIVLNIPVNLTPAKLAKYCHVSRDSFTFEAITEAVPLVNAYGLPKAILRRVSVDMAAQDITVLNGIRFKSRLVAEKLAGVSRVFASVVTAGEGLEQCPDLKDDPFLDLYRGALVYHATEYVIAYLKNNFGYDGASLLKPGALPDWPIENNHPLFRLIGKTEEIGVSLNEAGYIRPWNSGSSIHFAGNGFQNCSLCKRTDCIDRRAKFDKKEYLRIFGRDPEALS